MHNLIVGASFSGKTNLARYFAFMAESKGQTILVYDPLESNGWPKTAKKFSSVSKFVKAFWQHEKCHVFIDESKVLFTEDTKAGEKIAYQGRHRGHLVYFIGQRAQSMIPPNARDMCGKVFAFKQSADDSKTLAQSYTKRLEECKTLQKLEFVFSDGFTDGKGKLIFDSKEMGKPPKSIQMI